MSAAPDMLVQLSTEQLEQLLRKCVREELEQRGYAAEDEILDKERAAKMFDVSTRTVTNWMRRQAMPHHKGHGGHVYFKRAELATWSEEHGVPIKRKAA